MVIGQTPPTAPPINANSLNIRSNSIQLAKTPQVALSNTMSLTASGNNLVIDPRVPHPQSIQLQPLGVSNATAVSGQNLQFQILNVNSTSRPTITVPTASVSAGYSISNLITPANASIPSVSKMSQPRVVLPSNVRFSGVRPGSPGFSQVPIPNVVRGGTILVKAGDSGHFLQMVNVGQGPQFRTLQVPPGAASPSVSAVGGVNATPGLPTPIRNPLPGSIVLPVNAVNNAPSGTTVVAASPVAPVVNAIQANKTPSVVAPAPGTSPHQQPLSVHTTAANSQAASAAPSQMSPTTAKKKCKNFLSTLLRLASDQPDTVATNVKSLIQGLIDNTIQPEDFTNQLQKELNSSPQPCLVPFLKKSLPYLRDSLMKEELTIDGVRPPPMSSATSISSNIPPMTPPTLSHIQNIGSSVPTPRPASIPPGVRILGPQTPIPGILGPAVPPGAQIIHTHMPGSNSPLGPIVLSPVNTSNHLAHPPSNIISTTISPNTMPQPRLSIHPVTPTPMQPLQSLQPIQPSMPIPTTIRPSVAPVKKTFSKAKVKDKVKKEKVEPMPAIPTGTAARPERASSSFRDDDDINDVATMGGVNLLEESQRILASNAEIIGQQIRSCKDEPFLYASPLHLKLNKIAKSFGLEDCSNDVVALVSHATEERLKTLVEKLGVYAEHRQQQLRNNPNYEIIQDIKGQAQFLQEMDRIEKRRHEEQEREVLIKAAKSRSKVDDPDHIAIKARAKEMQRLEMEEIRQREANETALQAIGNPKKRLKTYPNTSSNLSSATYSSTFSANNNNNNNNNVTNNNLFSSFTSKPFKRIKRVTMKDVLFLLENDHNTIRSPVLYKSYAR